MKKRIGLALSGGGASGLCHIGVLKVLDENHVTVDAISGCSFCALIGGLYCSGYKARDIEKLAKETKWQRLLDFTLPVNSFIRGRRIENTIRKLIQNRQFHDLEPKFFVGATNFETGGEVVFQEGDVSSAIRASIAIPGIIAAKRINKQRFVDGVLVDPTGIFALKEKCDALVVVDLSVPFQKSVKLMKSKKTRENELLAAFSNNVMGNFMKLLRKNIKERQFKRVPKLIVNTIETIVNRIFTPSRFINLLSGGISPQMIEIVLRSQQIVMSRLYNLNLELGKPDIIIKPEYSYLGYVEFDRVDDFVRAGEEATNKVLAQIKKLF